MNTGIKTTLQRLRLNSGGYDSMGSYWGHGQRLYTWQTEDGAQSGTLRAADREAAKVTLRATIDPNMTFYR